MVIVGTPDSVFIPDLGRIRVGAGRLRGLRLFLTHLRGEPLTEEDLMDMLFLRLDSVAALTVDNEGDPEKLHIGHILPSGGGKPYEVLPPQPWSRPDFDFEATTLALEEEFARVSEAVTEAVAGGEGKERALLVSVSTAPKVVQERSLDELEDLAKTAGLACMGRIVQRVGKVNPQFILGKGKLAELEVQALAAGAEVILFDQELSPTQMRNLAKVTERKILDRTQLILDIFAQHAKTRSGKFQVEMAQLEYMLPRLVGQNRALSRLAGGIGGRGPGETKLELSRRRIRERTARIRKELAAIRKRRGATRARRAKSGVPIVSLVGYTNAGKSTLLNTLTSSEVLAENKLFATLDPTSRRIRFPKDREIILTDTVGFIRDLPMPLREAFRATLEELESADLLVLVADASHPEVEDQVEAVEKILGEMDLAEVPRLLVLNKWDRLSDEERIMARNLFPHGIPAVARDRASLEPLVEAILEALPGAVAQEQPPWDAAWDEEQ